MTVAPKRVSGERRIGGWRQPVALIALACVMAVLTGGAQVHGRVYHDLRYAAAIALLWILPALAWSRCLPGSWPTPSSQDVGMLTRLVGGLGLAFVASGLLTLVLHLLPGAFPTGALRVTAVILVAAPLLLARWVPCAPVREPDEQRRIDWKLMVLLVAVVALLARLPNLGYSEFQGDEAVILQRAAQALEGDDAELFLHQKGPVEILIPMSLWALSGTLNEWQARLPFVIVGLLAVLAAMALAAAWFGSLAGLVTGLVVALNGFLVAFARIIQYQNIVVGMGLLGVLWVLRYRYSGRRIDLVLGVVFFAFGLLAHYDAVLLLPAAGVLILAMLLPLKRNDLGRRLGDIGVAICAGGVILALFYLPFIMNPMFGRTFSYLSAGRLGGGGLHNSLWDVWRMSTFYNSIYYVVGVAALVLGAAMVRTGSLAAWLTFAVPFVFYSFVVADPRTHVYTFYPGAAILAGGAAQQFATGARCAGSAVRRRTLVSAGVGLWSALCAGYIGLVFVNHRVEYKRMWPESRMLLYPVPFADEELPPYGHFGFPYRAGWKAVEHLFATGALSGTYASNEEPEITTWYVRSGSRTMCGHPDVYVVAQQVQDEIAIDWDEIERDYVLAYVITAAGRDKIGVYVRRDAAKPPVTLSVESVAAAYDSATTPSNHLLKPGFGAAAVQLEPSSDFGNVARLLGYEINPAFPQPGDLLTITLYWEALSSPGRNYQVFTHLVHEGELIAQHDGAPACAFAPTSLWEKGEFVRDEHVILLGQDLPSGEMQLRVGVYDLLTFDHLAVVGENVDSVVLQSIELNSNDD